MLALGMAFVFLLPTAYMSRELWRTQDLDMLGRRYLTIAGLYHLMLPSNFHSSGAISQWKECSFPSCSCCLSHWYVPGNPARPRRAVAATIPLRGAALHRRPRPLRETRYAAPASVPGRRDTTVRSAANIRGPYAVWEL